MRAEKIIFLAAVSVVLVWSLLLILQSILLIQDEFVYYDQTIRFTYGDFFLNPIAAVLPGYSLILAFFANLFHTASVPFIRIVAFFLNVLAIPVFYITARKLDRHWAWVKTLEFTFFPILFPFFPLIYTDIFSTMLVMLSFYFILERRYSASGMIAIFSIFIRQTNIVWLIFINCMMYFQEYGLRVDKKALTEHARKSAVFLAGLVIFGMFIYANHGFAVGAKDRWQFSSLIHLGNVYFFLFLAFALFLPTHLANARKIGKLINRNKIIIAPVAVGFIFFLLTFVNDHPWNQAWWFLRNYILIAFTINTVSKAIFFPPLLIACLSFAVMKFHRKPQYLLYPFIFVALVTLSLVEQRYYFIPFAFLILFKKSESRSAEYITIGSYIVLSIVFLVGIAAKKFFL